MSHWKEYKKERENAIVIEDEYGFVVAKELEDYMYIEDIFVVKEKRQSKIAFSYADKITELAKEKGYTKLLGSVDPKANGSTVSLKVILAYGFKLYQMDNNLIYFIKEI